MYLPTIQYILHNMVVVAIKSTAYKLRVKWLQLHVCVCVCARELFKTGLHRV